MKVKGQMVQAGERYKRTDRQTDERYQVHYLPHFAVDNKTTFDLENLKFG